MFLLSKKTFFLTKCRRFHFALKMPISHKQNDFYKVSVEGGKETEEQGQKETITFFFIFINKLSEKNASKAISFMPSIHFESKMPRDYF